VGLPKLLIASTVASLILTSGADARGPFGTINEGLWKGGAYTNDQTGAFSHCGAGAQYVNGVGLILSQLADRTWTILFVSKSWNMTLETTYPIDLVFDGQAQFRIYGKAIKPIVIVAPLPDAALARLRRSHLMAATGDGQTYQFNVSTVGKAVSAISNCVDFVKAEGVEKAGNFSGQSVKSAMTASPVKETGPETAPKLIQVTGTGFIISTDGHVLTNDHVINSCVGDVHGNLTGEPAAVLRIVSQDETNDLALLQVPGSFKETARIRATAMHSGDSVIAIGFPLHGLLTSDFTVTTGIVNSLSGFLNDSRYLQISAPIQPGNSGGPLLDTTGNVVGVVAEKINAVKFAKMTGDIPENINFAIKTGMVRDFLDNAVIAYQTAEPGAELKVADVASRARAYVMLITCTGKAHESAKK
jgi:S1-C subfamily serine protease